MDKLFNTPDDFINFVLIYVSIISTISIVITIINYIISNRRIILLLKNNIKFKEKLLDNGETSYRKIVSIYNKTDAIDQRTKSFVIKYNNTNKEDSSKKRSSKSSYKVIDFSNPSAHLSITQEELDKKRPITYKTISEPSNKKYH